MSGLDHNHHHRAALNGEATHQGLGAAHCRLGLLGPVCY